MTHFKDENETGPLCGEEGPVETTDKGKRITCPECRILLRHRRRARLKKAEADAEIARILKKREQKLRARIARKEAGKFVHLARG